MRALLVLFFILSISTYSQAQNPGQDTSAAFFVIGSISLEGNRVTKPRIIQRELTFAVGDTIKAEKLEKLIERSKYNLINTLLFNFVDIDITREANEFHVHIKLVERWYIFPIPFVQIAERNFNAWWANKDFSRLDYGAYIIKNNFRGRKESITALVRLGFNEQYRLTYDIPYLNKKQTLGISFTSGYSQHHEIFYASKDNKQQFFKSEKRSTHELDGMISLNYRQGLYSTHSLMAGYDHAKALDTVVELNPQYFHSGENSIELLNLTYFYQYDYRDSKIYPLKGHYFTGELKKYGLGILKNEKTDVWTLEVMTQKFFQLSKRWYWAGSLKGKVSSEAFQPYYIQRGLGYFLDFIRGYEPYVIDGQHYGLFKSNLKFAIIPTKVWTIKKLKQGRFNPIPYALYANLHYDAGYVVDNQFNAGNHMANDFQHGFGAGIDFVTYYDRVVRMEYSFNKFGESGFFIHFTSSL